MTRKLIDNLYALSVPEIQKIFLQVMQGIVDSAMINEMVKAIENKDEEALIKASGFNVASLGKILDAIEEVYQNTAQATVSEWPTRIKTPTGVSLFSFNMRNPRVEQELKNYSGQFITRISDDVRYNIQAVLEQGMIRGDNPRTTALDIVGRIDPVTKKRVGGVIGLDQRQVRWVSSARSYLENLDQRYFTLGLRDKRFDKTVEKAIENGSKLDPVIIEKLLTSYKNKALSYRAEAISRTETIQAINRAEMASVLQGIEEGVIQSKAVRKEWDDVGDSRERTTHRILGNRYGRSKGIRIDEAFVSPSGSRMMFPGDTSLGASAAEIVHCRCRLKISVDWIVNSE